MFEVRTDIPTTASKLYGRAAVDIEVMEEILRLTKDSRKSFLEARWDPALLVSISEGLDVMALNPNKQPDQEDYFFSAVSQPRIIRCYCGLEKKNC